ncbi:hypothetical protein GWK47_015263 [Chionoecetes opilio]|uniref:Uncharacterized protein n=1 Tax=Chionoecetes opilio TaxID=41210 RepID=A0A8J5CK78_CHIOP|nr:hypothetical protein GWK47_015263 [Chionoecetes opilio]
MLASDLPRLAPCLPLRTTRCHPPHLCLPEEDRWISEQVDQREEQRGWRRPSGKRRGASMTPSRGAFWILPCPRVYCQPWVVHRFKQRFSLHNIARRVTQQMKDIVDLAHTVGGEGFSDMTEEDVAELIDSMEQSLQWKRLSR